MMNITEVRVKMVSDGTERLRAFCSVTLEGAFVIRDLKVIDGSNGPFVAMPSRKLADRCPKCSNKNHLRARFCNECGTKLNENRAPRDAQGRIKLHADVAHPINAPCREQIQDAVIAAYEEELELQKQPGYEPKAYDIDIDEDEAGSEYEQLVAEMKASVERKNGSGRKSSFQPDPVSSDPEPAQAAPEPRSKPPVSTVSSESPVGDNPEDDGGFGAGIF